MSYFKTLKVIFPGVRYDKNKPLLKMFNEAIKGDEIALDYSSFFHGETREENTLEAYEYVKKELEKVDFSKYNEVIFIMKSIGTYLGLKYRKEFALKRVKALVLTPLDISLEYLDQTDYIVYGTLDKYLSLDARESLKYKYVNLSIVENANHRLEVNGELSPKLAKRIFEEGMNYLDSSSYME